MGDHEVYICYDHEDQLAADTICNALEDNDVKCWLKSRDGSVDVDVDEIMEAIKQSSAVVLIYSEYSKVSNYVNTETDISFSEKKPILTFNIDETEIGGGLKFFINKNLIFDIFPDTDGALNSLTKAVFKALNKDSSQLSFSDKTKKLEKELIKESKKRIAARHRQGVLSKIKKPLIAAVVILVIGVCIFAFMNFDDGVGGTSQAEKSLPNITMKVTDFHLNDLRKQDTDWNYSYNVVGTFSPQPDDDGYNVVVDFYDKSGYLVNSTETPLKNIQIVNKGSLLGSTVSDAKDIKRVDVQLINKDNIVVAHADSSI